MFMLTYWLSLTFSRRVTHYCVVEDFELLDLFSVTRVKLYFQIRKVNKLTYCFSIFSYRLGKTRDLYLISLASAIRRGVLFVRLLPIFNLVHSAEPRRLCWVHSDGWLLLRIQTTGALPRPAASSTRRPSRWSRLTSLGPLVNYRGKKTKIMFYRYVSLLALCKQIKKV